MCVVSIIINTYLIFLRYILHSLPASVEGSDWLITHTAGNYCKSLLRLSTFCPGVGFIGIILPELSCF